MLNPNDTSKTNNRQIPVFQPMGLGGILDATLSLYRDNLRLFLGIASIYFVLIALQEGIIVSLLERSSSSRLDDIISDVDSVSDTFIYMLVIGVSYQLNVIRSLLIKSALRGTGTSRYKWG